MQIAPEAIAAMKKFQHEAALSKADFSSSYGANAEKCSLFREKSLLVATLKIKKKSKGKYVLSLLNNKNLGIHLIRFYPTLLSNFSSAFSVQIINKSHA